MASIFIRRNCNILSRSLSGNYKDPFCPKFQFTFECLGYNISWIHPHSRGYASDSIRNDITDMTCPHTWYPQARRKRRKVFLHVGPTNSGKTYQALKQLQSSASGIYCGPLRLLAWEVAKRLNKANVPCDLITGQEREEVEGANHKAVTVEMADMLGCNTRGYSFTRALLGIAADELHLCGDPAAVPLIQDILDITGDEVEVQYYKRLSPLVPMKVPLRSLSEIRNGDCIVTFSRRDIYKLKKRIEREGKHLCSVVYGSLPPETRTRQFIWFWCYFMVLLGNSFSFLVQFIGLQASMFNDASSEFDVLVASDAIGMGLNLNISRIIFSTMQKFDGFEMRDLTVSEIKQIAGRAGRYGSNFPLGEVTCMYGDDLPLLHSALDSPSPILERAGLLPSYDLLYMYSRLHPQIGFYQVMKVAAVIDEFPLELRDKYLFCISPVDMDDEISSQGLTQFAENYAKKGLVRLREIFTPGTLRVPKTPSALKELESIHKVLDLYVWLSFRLDESFPDHELASSQKALCSMLIEEFLDRYGWQKPMAGRLP
ncbi:hypothetical protein TSUD_228610, partial [Trifolium subterraneum]